ncbi:MULTISPECIES: hypothetical protein [Pontibacillus]|uniref:Uncharacterized protein n=1 Tax=Pontibacillus chungwhensis TaxID=265426 RepID=A0ABY8V2V4_9BACI|nr:MULTISPECIES: hypothetical protein [Pontibacillus]MCD5324370.1 hypothetical protein [Pontibacillus sp. HN14]WIF99331.1 hypothetical protein QNI29_06655 [Pontibacillus chungwhensis]
MVKKIMIGLILIVVAFFVGNQAWQMYMFQSFKEEMNETVTSSPEYYMTSDSITIKHYDSGRSEYIEDPGKVEAFLETFKEMDLERVWFPGDYEKKLYWIGLEGPFQFRYIGEDRVEIGKGSRVFVAKITNGENPFEMIYNE